MELNAVLKGLRPELEHPGKKARARIWTQRRALVLRFEANSSTALRAILSSYLRLLAATLSVCDNLIKLERLSEVAERKSL